MITDLSLVQYSKWLLSTTKNSKECMTKYNSVLKAIISCFNYKAPCHRK